MEQPVDLIHFERLTNKDKEIEQEVFNVFFKEADIYIRAMIRARQEINGKAWGAAVLALRGSAIHVGAMHLVEFLSTIEGGENLSSDVRAMQVKIALREIGKVRDFCEKRTAKD